MDGDSLPDSHARRHPARSARPRPRPVHPGRPGPPLATRPAPDRRSDAGPGAGRGAGPARARRRLRSASWACPRRWSVRWPRGASGSRSLSRPGRCRMRWPAGTCSAGRRPARARRSRSAWPMLARLAGRRQHRARQPTAPRGLVLVPDPGAGPAGRRRAAPLGQPVGVSVTTVYGGAPIGRQIDRLRRGVDIVVATPGRLIDLMERRACTLGAIEITVLDEADHMADLGFLPAVTRILDATPAGGQRMLFSATLDRDVERLVTRYLTSPALHAVAPGSEPGAAADHQVLRAARRGQGAGRGRDRRPGPARTLFFVRTKHGADRLAKQLTRAGAERGRHPRQPEPEPAAARAGRVRRRAAPGAGRHRRGRPRAGHRGRRPGRALRPAQRPQGLPAPLRPDGAGRGTRHGGRVR